MRSTRASAGAWHMADVAAVVLGGGRGERLKPLTAARAKPAVPFAGMYRLIDIPISNCLHGGIDHIFCLTQYQSASLNRHVAQTYRFDVFSSGHVTVLAAEQTDTEGSDWYHGTADAVRKQLHRLDTSPDGDVIILSGDQVYLMDMADLVLHHREMNADVTIAATRVTAEDARRFGVMRVDEEGVITEFAEKPSDPAIIERFAVPDVGALTDGRTHLGSMGIYVFRRRVLEELLAEDPRNDFGKHILPSALGTHRLASYAFDGFWEDVGTIPSYHAVNLGLTDAIPDFNLFHQRLALYTRARFLPPAKIGDAVVQRALIAPGAIIGDGATVQQSIVGIRTVVGPRCVLDHVVCNGAGAFDLFDPKHPEEHAGRVRLGIGRDSILRNVIIDRDARIGAGVHLVNRRQLQEFEDDYIRVRGGIIVVPRQVEIPDGYTF